MVNKLYSLLMLVILFPPLNLVMDVWWCFDHEPIEGIDYLLESGDFLLTV